MLISAPDTVELRVPPPEHVVAPPGLPAIRGGWTERSVNIADHRFALVLPAAPDDLLDDPAMRAAYDRSEYMPYWAFLWPSAIYMAGAILQQRWVAGTVALELGAGVGLVGLAACKAGLDVTFTDYDATAVALCRWNARQNGFAQARSKHIDWQAPPAETYPVIFASDVLYEDRNHPGLIALLERMLPKGGVAWFGEPGRAQVERFCCLLTSAGLSYRLFDQHQQELPRPRLGSYQLIEVRRG